MQLESTLAQFPLPELITMIIGSSVTGCLEIGEVANGRMYFRDGRLYHAASDEHTGLAAICQFFTMTDTPFRFTAGVAAHDETLWQDAWDVIEVAQQYAATWQRVRRYVPSFTAIPVLVASGANAVAISEDAWRTLAVIDGVRSIDEIAAELGHVPIEIAAALCDLIEQGAVRLNTVAAVPCRPEPPHMSRGFFGRMMALRPASEAQSQ